MIDLKRHIIEVPDFPKPGILFRDVTPLLQEHFSDTLAAFESLLSPSEWAQVDAVAGIESRGFILAGGIAARRGLGFVPIRKQGKLPPPLVSEAYELEYGSGVLEMHPGRGRLLLIDDVLATGGTMRAAAELSLAGGYEVLAFAALIDLRLTGDFIWRDQPLRYLIRYE